MNLKEAQDYLAQLENELRTPEERDEFIAVTNFAIDGIKDYPEVEDASAVKKGDRYSLAVRVLPGTSVDVARRAGDNFVRMMKGAVKDDSPGKEIGSGRYLYRLVVIDGHQIVAEGEKLPADSGIRWRA